MKMQINHSQRGFIAIIFLAMLLAIIAGDKKKEPVHPVTAAAKADTLPEVEVHSPMSAYLLKFPWLILNTNFELVSFNLK